MTLRLFLATMAVGAMIIGLATWASTPEPTTELTCETTSEARLRLEVPEDFVGPVLVECK